MTQATDVDIRELKDLILGLDKKIDIMDTRIAEVEKKIDKLDTKIDKQDNRLWLFMGLILTTAIATIFKLLAFPNL
jgi:peptidoglycan hydrolase CwlO-like protein